MNAFLDPKNGVFPAQWIRAAILEGIVYSDIPVTDAQVQPNSLDLRLGNRGYRVQCSFMPGEEGMMQKLEKYSWYDFLIPEEGIVLERNQIYIFPLCENLRLDSEVRGRANPKSTTGRLDIFCRLVTERSLAFDETPPGYSGPLYLEVVPRSFAVRIRPGDSLAQIRFQTGDPRIGSKDTAIILNRESILLGAYQETLRAENLTIEDGIMLSIALPKRLHQRQQATLGYQARKNTKPIDLRAIGQSSKRRYWDRIYADGKPVILEPDEFYVFRSRELVRLPPYLCAEMVAFDAGSGELRTHYAGFFDTGFGYLPDRTPQDSAAAVVLEVRSRDVPFLIEDGQQLFRIHLLRCTEPPDFLYGSHAGSSYQSQRDVRLSKQFTGSYEEEETDPMQPHLNLGL